MELITPAEYARRRKVSDVAVHKAVRRGRICLIDGKIDPAVADIQWEANTRKRVDYHGREKTEREKNNQAQGTSQLWKYREQREAAEAQLKEIELEQALGNLIDADDARRVEFETARAVRDALLSLPDRLAPLLAAATSADECHRLLDVEIRAALTQVAERLTQQTEEAAA